MGHAAPSEQKETAAADSKKNIRKQPTVIKPVSTFTDMDPRAGKKKEVDAG